MLRKEVQPQSNSNNQFALLFDSDSDESVCHDSKAVCNTVVEPTIVSPTSLASLASASDMPLSPSVSKLPDSPPFRVWVRDDKEGSSDRFNSDEHSTLFSSPFHRTKLAEKKRWNRPRFQKDDDGWVSISWNQPQFLEEPEGTLTPPESDFPSLLLRGSEAPKILSESIDRHTDTSDKDSAAVWAERVKKCLEKAELSRPAKEPREGLDRLSFFRRAIVAPAPVAEN